jgi:hypothetical protein
VEVMDFTAQIIYILMTGCSRRDIVQPQSARPRISRPSTSQSQRSDIMPPTTGEKTDTSPVPRQRSASRLLKSANVYLYDDKNWEDTSETANFTQESNSNNSSGVSSGMTDVMTPESAVTPQSKPHVKAKKKKKRITWRRPTVVKPTPLVKNFVDDHKIPWYP